jgi:A/G-specific adenine glycosylase
MEKNKKNTFFTQQLLKWDKKQNSRAMPWKGEKDPYKIWLSEIILQQTRVEQGLGYYNRFIAEFPTIHDLAKAPETKVFKLWEGLGYYTRCKNIIITARYISSELKGKFPVTYNDILKLKGVGPYTAAAIASFAFNLPHAVVDGNVFRVLARYFGIDTPIDSITGKKNFTVLANELIDKKIPGKYNQALMDFGAVLCKPQQPLCDTCPLKPNCSAY